MNTQTLSLPRRKSAARGSALVAVIILCMVVLLLVGSYLTALSFQNKNSYRTTLGNESRNAAEGVAELAMGELFRRSQGLTSFGDGTNPGLLDGFSLGAVTGVHPDFRPLLASAATSANHIVASSLEFKSSKLSDGSPQTVIDRADPVNQYDTSTDKTVAIRTMVIYAKASALDPVSKQTATSYVAQHVRVTDETWFNNAIFYNMDLEMHAGALYNVTGPTFVNGDAYLTSWVNRGKEDTGLNQLTFTSTLFTTGKIYRFLKYYGAHRDPGGTWGGQWGKVVLTKKLGGTTDLQNRAYMWEHTTTNDSTRTPTNFLTVWGGTVNAGVPPFNPPGMQPYVPTTYGLSGANSTLRNNGYIMIEPQLSTDAADTVVPAGEVAYPVDLAGNKGDPAGHTGPATYALENMKFSAKAGFVIQVQPLLDTYDPTNKPQPRWRLVRYEGTDDALPLSQANPPKRDAKGKPIIACIIDPFTDKDDVDYPAPSTEATIKRALKIALLKAIVSVPYKDDGSAGSWGSGTGFIQEYTPKATTYAATVAEPTLGVRVSTGETDMNGKLKSAAEDIDPKYYPVYDRREGFNGAGANNGLKGAYHTLIIDMVQLHKVLNNASLWLKPNAATYVYEPKKHFTGLVYVQMPLAPIDTVRFGLTGSDKIRPALAATTTRPGYAVLVRNAGGSSGAINGGSWFRSTGFLPRVAVCTDVDGFTLATNGPVFIWGNYNSNGENAGTAATSTTADGDWATDHADPASSTGAKYVGKEIPALIAADSVTVLSSKGHQSNNDIAQDWFPDMAKKKREVRDFTEISTAIITGLVPTVPKGWGVGQDPLNKYIWAGGVHNLVRFIEDWQIEGDKTLYGYRGSLVALYESEVAKAPYRDNDIFTYWFEGPDLAMGYHAFFKNGRFPPGTIISRTLRRLNLQDISAATYNAGPATPGAYNN